MKLLSRSGEINWTICCFLRFSYLTYHHVSAVVSGQWAGMCSLMKKSREQMEHWPTPRAVFRQHLRGDMLGVIFTSPSPALCTVSAWSVTRRSPHSSKWPGGDTLSGHEVEGPPSPAPAVSVSPFSLWPHITCGAGAFTCLTRSLLRVRNNQF